MQIPLHHFEDFIDETILRRGLSYFKKGQVHEPEEIRTGEYEAIVEGTKDYTVRMTMKNGIITEHVCTCPYDMGPVCKHVVAVIFYLQQDELDLKQKPVKTKSVTPKKSRKRKTIAEQVDELLEKATHDELKQFVKEQATRNAAFRNLLLLSFVQHNDDDSNGDIGYAIEAAYEMLYTLAASQPDEDVRKLIIDYALSAVDKRVYAEWDWHFGMLRIAAKLLKTEEEIESLCKQLDRSQRSEHEREDYSLCSPVVY